MGADSPDTWDGSGDDNFDGEGIGMKPIEPGCLALTKPFVRRRSQTCVPSHTVTVLTASEMRTTCYVCNSIRQRWRIETPHANNAEYGVTIAIACECCLIRIDGGDPDAITETDKEKDHAYTC